MLNRNLPGFPTLTTERLVLRQLLESDAEEIYLLRSDVIINRYLDREPSKTLEDALNFIRKINENFKNNEVPYWAITQKNNEKLIGTICLFDFSEELKRCEIGYELLPGYQGQGFMNEAVKKVIEYSVQALGIKTIDACTHKGNQSSIKLLQKFNFEKTEIVDETNPNLILFRL
jgi:ribosomal-protein-alanine N-acetyltransferase